MSDKSVDNAIEEYCTALRRRQIEGSLPCAKRTADVLRLIITQQKHPNGERLASDIRLYGSKLQAAKPVELAIGNMVRRVLHIIREEVKEEERQKKNDQTEDSMPSASSLPHEAASEAPRGPQKGALSQLMGGPGKAPVGAQRPGSSLFNLIEYGVSVDEQTAAAMAPIEEATDAESVASARPGGQGGARGGAGAGKGGKGAGAKQGQANWKGKHEVIEQLNELIDELDEIQHSITVQGVEHIHANEVILTFGMSDTTFHFLKEAGKKREFQVVVAEGAPRFDGHEMARRLSDAGIQTTLIADSAVYAMMARANKVLVGAHAVLANGGVIAPVGLHLVALAAKQHSIPFVVLVGLHKLSPLFPHDPDLVSIYNDFRSPADVVDYGVVSEAFHQQEALATRGRAAGAAGAATSGSPPTLPSSGLSGAGSSGPSPAQRLEPLGGNVHAPNPLFDYVPPHLISLFITDVGGRVPSYVYRMLMEYYSREDYLLSKELVLSGVYQ